MKKLCKAISIFLCSIIAFTTCACNYDSVGSQSAQDSQSSDSSGQVQKPSGGGEEGGIGADDIIQTVATTVSYDYNDYIGDLETFVYGLLITKLEYIYNVFPAYVELSSGYCVYGLGYTDYAECYTNEDESVAYFMSGFIPFVGELEIPQEDFDTGLYLYNLDYQDEETIFVLKYKSEAFVEHCVVYDTYLQYGVNELGNITYNAIPFEREKCDTSLGSLYSYDTSRYLYDVDFGEYMPISGVSLAETFDYAKFEKEVNAFIEEQNANWMTYDVETVAYTSQDAVVGYLLSLQEETFLGYPVEQLIELSKDLDPMQCFRVTPDGLTIVDIQEEPPKEPSSLCKWLVGSACAIVAAVGIVATCAAVVIPTPWKEMVSTLAGAATGASIEIFMQVVVDNRTLEDVQWSKVLISTVSGAVSGLLNPYLMGMGGAKGFLIDTAVDSLIGGVEYMAFAYVDGARGGEVLSSFGVGFTMGAIFSAGFKGISEGISAVAKKLSKPAQEVAENLSPKLTRTAANIADSVGDNADNSIGKAFKDLKKVDNPNILRAKNQINKNLDDCLADAVAFKKGANNVADEVAAFTKKQTNKSFKSLAKDGWMDLNGNAIPKTQVKEIFEQVTEGDAIAKRLHQLSDGSTIEVYVKKVNNTFSVEFPGKKYNIGALTGTRTNNFLKTASKMIDEGFEDVPSEITDALLKKYPGLSLDDIIDGVDKNKLANDVVDIVQSSKYVFDESVDLKTITLTLREVHDKVKGYKGISHMGGIGYLKSIKATFGIKNFAEYVNAALNGFKISFAT